MGTVWQAEDELLGRQVALKEVVPPTDVTEDESRALRERTLREARTAARLTHPNVVTVYDVVDDSERPWIVMELLNARSLRDILQDNGPLPVPAVARIGMQLLAALRAAHRLGVVHRDVKPGNVLIGQDGRAVLADFGIARGVDGTTRTTTSGVLVGSPAYIAPERARGERGGAASDLWSLGATLYTAVEGRPPFQREGALPTLAAVVTQEPDPPRRAGALWPVISGLLHRDERERLSPEMAESMLASLAAADDAPDTAPLPPSVARQETSGSLERAERTLSIHPAVVPETAADETPVPAESEAEAGTEAPAEPAHAEPGPPVPAEPMPTAETVVPAPPGTPRRGTRRRAAVLGLGGAAAAGIAAVIALSANGLFGPTASGHRGAGAAGRPPASPASSPAATAGQRSSPPASSGQPSGPPAGGTAAVPTGWHRYHDPTGFSIAVPAGWQVSHQGHYVYVRDPAGGRFLLIDQTTHPKPNPLADWRQQEANRISTYPGYHRIRLQSVQYPQAERAADWEFTYNGQDGPTHVLNRNVLANAHHAYALYWSTPASQWARSFRFFRVFAATFRPAPS